MRVIGCDPGLSGALWYFDYTQGDTFAHLDMPTIEVNGKRRIDGYSIHDWLIDIGPVDRIVLEQVQGVQQSGATSAFTFGEGFGLIQGLLIALERPWQLVRPQRWTKDLGLTRDKGAHRLAAQRMFPMCADLFGRAKDDGRADAALIAHWFYRNERRAA